MNFGDLLNTENIILGSFWNLKTVVNGYGSLEGNVLVTQVSSDRNFQILHLPNIDINSSVQSLRMMVRLLEDGYKCWLTIDDVIQKASRIDSWSPTLLTTEEILRRIPKVLLWLKESSKIPNNYLWGGTIGPDFDCSGLVQAAFSSQQIWLPRDAYQQEAFCKEVKIDIMNPDLLRPGDLCFFGTHEKSTHVGIHLSGGEYIHSSGISHGLNGIGFSSLYENDSISSYYRSVFRSAGRICVCHTGAILP